MTFVIPQEAAELARLCEVVNDEVRYRIDAGTRVALIARTFAHFVETGRWDRDASGFVYKNTDKAVVYDYADIYSYNSLTDIAMIEFLYPAGQGVETRPCFIFELPPEMHSLAYIIVPADDVYMVKK